jgi:DNA replication protein DnaC
MSTLKLYGMRSAYDEGMENGIKRQHEPPRIVGDLLQSEIAEKQARSIRYQLSIAKLPLAKDIDDFDFADTPVNESLVRELATGTFVADQRNVVLVGGTGTGKSHLVVAIARALIRDSTRGRFFNVVDLVNRLETETRNGKQGRTADYLTCLDFIILDELGNLPFAQAGGQLHFHLISRLYERTMNRLFEYAGIKQRNRKGEDGEAGGREVFHSLRGGNIDDMRDAKIEARDRRMQSGHQVGSDEHDNYGFMNLGERQARQIAELPLDPGIDFSVFRGLDFDRIARRKRVSGPSRSRNGG